MSLPTSVIPSREPDKLFVDAAAAWTKSLPDFPATLWRLDYKITPPSGNVLNVAWATHVTASGTNFAITIPKTFITGITAGGSGRLTGTVTELADTSVTKVIYDATLQLVVIGERSIAQRMLTLIDAALLNNVSREEQSVQVSFPGGTTKAISLCSKEELIRVRSYWQSVRQTELDQERADGGRPSRRFIRRRYVNP